MVTSPEMLARSGDGAMFRGDGSPAEPAPTNLRIGDWTIHPRSNRVERGNSDITLQHLSMQVLLYLAERPGKVVFHDELLAAIWNGRATGEYAVHRRVADIRHALGDDARNPQYVETIPKRGYRLIAKVSRGKCHGDRPRHLHFLAAAAAVLAIGLVASQVRESAIKSELDESLRIAEELIASEQYRDAYDLLLTLPESLQQEPRAGSLMTRAVVPVTLETSPQGVEVSYRAYDAPNAEWQKLGTTPLSATLPKGAWRLRLAADAHETLEIATTNPGYFFNNVGQSYYVLELPELGAVPADMVYVPAVEALVPILGYRQFSDLGEFWIGRMEVSNREYAAFLDAGGYENPDYWTDFLGSTDAFAFDQVRQRFVDSTGMTGPAVWADGVFPAGDGDLPVTGISWYEAMAYARFRDASLPTAQHWARAALGLQENRHPLARVLVPHAHLDGLEPIPANSDEALSTWGAVNLVGNVLEWTRSYSGGGKLSLGGSYAGPAWRYAAPNVVHPMERRPDQGFRIARYDESEPLEALHLDGKLPDLPIVSDAEYRKILVPLLYEPGSLDTSKVEVTSETEEEAWLLRRVRIPTLDPLDDMPVLIYLPKNQATALQSVIYVPPYDSYASPYPSSEIDIRRMQIDFVVASGRALIWPIYWGTHERFNDKRLDTPQDVIQSWNKAWRLRRNEVGRLIDFLEFDATFDANRIALMGLSFGASYVSPHILATESRIDVAIMLSARLAPEASDRTPVHLNPNTYWPRVKTPMLILNGRYDIMQQYRPEYAALEGTIATPGNNKKSIFYNASHWPLPAHRVQADSLAWLDEYLGTP